MSTSDFSLNPNYLKRQTFLVDVDWKQCKEIL